MEESISGVEESISGVEESISGVEESISGVEESISGLEESLRCTGLSNGVSYLTDQGCDTSWRLATP